MNWKEFGLKTAKGAVSGAAAIAGGLFFTGHPFDANAAKMAGGAVISAAFHGAWNAAAQYLDGSL